jgi:ubiquitin C-terminal hydrolase
MAQSTLNNLGNTCYINACIQILSHTTDLNNLLNNEGVLNKLNANIDANLLREWDALRLLMQSKNSIISPKRFLHIIQTVAKEKKVELFTGYSQNDINEFFLFVIDTFHNSLSRSVNTSITGTVKNKTDNLAMECYKTIQTCYKNGYSEIYDIFNGMYVSIISDFSTNKQLNYKCESFLTLELPIPNNHTPTIEDCFNLYTEEEEIVGENAWFDKEQNKKIDIKKRLLFWSFPKILVITLKRFIDEHNKNNKNVIFPINELDLSKYVVGYNKNIYKYSLYGVCNHHGSVPFGGHYTSIVKSGEGQWMEYNDNLVKETKKIISSKAYCLFYRRIENN